MDLILPLRQGQVLVIFCKAGLNSENSINNPGVLFTKM